MVQRQCQIRKHQGLTLLEMMITITVISLFLLLANTVVVSRVHKYTFKSDIQDFLSTVQMAATTAAESGRRYEVSIYPMDQSYRLREITSSQLDDVRQEDIIDEGGFGQSCRVEYIEFDDGEMSRLEPVHFRVGHRGWAYGGKIVFLNQDDQPVTVLINRLNRTVEMVEGDVDLLTPKSKEELPFATPAVGR